MKRLQDYINEAASTNIFVLIDGLKYDFSDTSSINSSSKQNRAKKAKAQEEILINTINNAQDEYHAIGIEEYCDSIGKSYSYELDSKIGDIIIMKNNKPVLFIDLKVAETDKYVGTPDMLSLVNFAADNDDKKYYLCCKINGVDSKLVKANKVYNKVLSKEATIIVSKDRSHISPEVKKLTDKVKLVAPKGMNNADTSKLYDEDFVASTVIQKL